MLAGLLLLSTAACAGDGPSAPDGPVVFTGLTVIDPTGAAASGVQELRIEGDRITAVASTVDRQGAEIREHPGRFVVPAFVDSHVHLAYRDEPAQMMQGGVAAVVDWASPVDWLAEATQRTDGLSVVASGPMITAPGGYPTRSWGRNGYGAECETGPDCIAAVERHRAAGARVVKIPITTGPELSDDVVGAVIAHAHANGLLVGVHALSDAQARRAAERGADILVHIPTETLAEDTVALWADRTVIPTLDAFGASVAAVDNLRRLRMAGTRVVYGTDFGNSRTPGIQPAELQAMSDAGMDGPAILHAGIAAPAGLFGFDLGIAPGRAASFLVLDADPRADPQALTRPVEVWVAGVPR
jgi:imidazolonepropionase-like amidohydrolase